MVEQEDLELGALALGPAALLERALEDELALLVAQSQVLQWRARVSTVRRANEGRQCEREWDARLPRRS